MIEKENKINQIMNEINSKRLNANMQVYYSNSVNLNMHFNNLNLISLSDFIINIQQLMVNKIDYANIKRRY